MLLETVQVPAEKKRIACFNEAAQQLNLNKRQVKFKTCADVYNHWRTYKKLYKKAPEDGIEFQIEYIDTGVSLKEEARETAPVVLALHGAPGSYHDFVLLINHLAHQNVRVIAPNFPEYVATVKTKVLFRHSADEKAAYLRDFLAAIQVDKIDLLISHSSAIFPTLIILLNANREAIERQQRQQQQTAAPQLKDVTNTQPIRTEDDQQDGLSPSIRDPRRDSEQATEITATTTADEEEAAASGPDESEEEELGDSAFEGSTIDSNNNSTAYNDNDDEDQVSFRSLDQETAADEPPPPLPSPPTEIDSPRDDTTHVEGENQPKKNKSSRKLNKELQKEARRLQVIVKFDKAIEIKAVALFNPAGHRLPMSMKPTWFKCGAVHVYQHKFGRSLFRKFGPAFLTVVGVPVRVDNMDNVMLSATVMRNSRCRRVKEQLEQLSQLKMPTLLVYSENDKLIEREIFHEMAQFMKLDSSKFDTFDNDGQVALTQSRADDWIRVMVFKAGGHYAYSNYAKTVNTAVSELLDKTVRNYRTHVEKLSS